MAKAHTVPVSPRAVSAIIDEEQLQLQDQKERRKKKSRRKTTSSIKRVTFALEEESSSPLFGEVKCCYAPPRPELSSEEFDRLYFHKKHFKSFKKESKKLARATDEETNKVYLLTFMQVYSQHPPPEKVGAIQKDDDLTFLPLATAPVRGLERYIFPGLVQDQTRMKQSVLKAQAKLLSDETITTEEQRAFVLASTSTILSRQSRHVARVIGHADSIVALGIYKKTFLPSSSTTSSSKSTTNKDNNNDNIDTKFGPKKKSHDN